MDEQESAVATAEPVAEESVVDLVATEEEPTAGEVAGEEVAGEAPQPAVGPPYVFIQPTGRQIRLSSLEFKLSGGGFFYLGEFPEEGDRVGGGWSGYVTGVHLERTKDGLTGRILVHVESAKLSKRRKPQPTSQASLLEAMETEPLGELAALLIEHIAGCGKCIPRKQRCEAYEGILRTWLDELPLADGGILEHFTGHVEADHSPAVGEESSEVVRPGPLYDTATFLVAPDGSRKGYPERRQRGGLGWQYRLGGVWFDEEDLEVGSPVDADADSTSAELADSNDSDGEDSNDPALD